MEVEIGVGLINWRSGVGDLLERITESAHRDHHLPKLRIRDSFQLDQRYRISPLPVAAQSIRGMFLAMDSGMTSRPSLTGHV